MQKNWIDFKKLRERLDFGEVLQHYGVDLKLRGNQHQGLCPLPGHEGETRPSFSANLERKIFQCFGCGAKGNLLDFAMLMEGHDREDGKALRGISLELQDRFLGTLPESETQAGTKGKSERTDEMVEEGKSSDLPIVINSTLDFELKKLDPTHPYLIERGFTSETVENFGAGHCSRGLMKGRIAIPLNDAAGALIGYAGRLVDERSINEENPKYRFPGRREHDGVIHEFHKSEFVYNGHRLTATQPHQDVIVVEGFTDVWWLWQCGFENVVALMGSDCSGRQAEIITSLVDCEGRVWIMPDGDPAGEQCALSVLEKVAPKRLCRWLKLEKDQEPTDLKPEELRQLLPNRSDP